jgi:chorismate mutase
MFNLDELRNSIQGLDVQLMNIIKRRMELTKQVAFYKSQHGLPILNQEVYDIKREEFRLFAVQNNIDPDFILELWETIHDNSILVQNLNYE